MKEKLKTLKDLDFAVFEPKCEHIKQKKFTMRTLYREEDLRQEAIKECNILSKCSAEDGSCGHADDAHTFLDNDSGSFSQNECVAVRQYIIWKNNLTDEELK